MRSIEAYTTYLKIKVAESKCCRTFDLKWQQHTKNPLAGRVRADSIMFRDGATLRFYEEVVLDGRGKVKTTEYSYGYKRPNDTQDLFRYDRDPTRIEPIVHEECHVHAKGAVDLDGRTLRLKTHPTNFEEVFDFIVATFYISL